DFWFAVVWLFQQGFRWAPTFHHTHRDRLPAQVPAIDVFVCTADPVREPPTIVVNTLLSMMAYEYPVEKLAFYLSDDGGSELTFYAAVLAAEFARDWLPFCRKFQVEPRSPRVYFSMDMPLELGDNDGFRREYSQVKRKFDDMSDGIENAARSGSVPAEAKAKHKGFREWDSARNPRDHQTILEILLKGNGEDVDASGNPMPTLVYLSREKRPGIHHHYKAGALNALNRVSSIISNAPLVLNVDCDMYSNNSESLLHAICFFLDPEKGNKIGYVQFPQSFNGITTNDLYANGVKRIYEIEFFGTNAHNGPMYAGTGSVHRRVSLNGKLYSPDFQADWTSCSGKKIHPDEWSTLEEKAKALASADFEKGTEWGKKMGLMYGCAVEDVFTGMVLHSRGWQSVFCSPEDRNAYLGLAPVNTNDTLIQHKRWSTGLLEIFLSDYCPWTHGPRRLKLGQIMCYSFYTLWALWGLPMLCYAILPSLCIFKDIPLFPKASDPWFRVFAFLGMASHVFSLVELIWAKGTFKMWWNETRMWMFKGSSSYLFSVIVIILKLLGVSESGFEITSKVIDEEASKRYEQEIMEFAVPSPMFIPPTTLALLNIYCFIRGFTVVLSEGLGALDRLALQIVISGYISVISIPVFEALFIRKDKGRIPTSITVRSLCLALALVYVFSLWI
ncbi:Cellulose synthase-like protein E6, partial [Nymphaea thermarum]